MARRSSKDAKLIMLGGWDLRADMSQQQRSREWLTEARFPWGEVLEENLDVGISRTSISQDGYFNDGVHAAHRALFAAQTASLPLIYNVVGAAVGSLTTMLEGARVQNLTEPVPAGQFVKFQATYQGDGRSSTRGILLKPLEVVTADGASAVLDCGVGSGTANGLWSVFQVSELNLGTATGLVLAVQESANVGGPFVTVNTVSFTDETVGEVNPGDGGHDAKNDIDLAVTVGRYLKLTWTWTGGAGGGSTAKIAVASARQ